MSKKSTSSKSTKSKSTNSKSNNKANKLSAVDESQLRIAFSMIDTNQDGKLNADELKCMLQRLGISVCDLIIDKFISEASKNGDCLISEQDFFNWMRKLKSSSEDDDLEQDLKAAFLVFDLDQNGYITKDELKSAMQLMGESLSDKDLEELLKATDLDKDGKINYEEFIKILL